MDRCSVHNLMCNSYIDDVGYGMNRLPLMYVRHPRIQSDPCDRHGGSEAGSAAWLVFTSPLR
jgi:hypothetical protein